MKMCRLYCDIGDGNGYIRYPKLTGKNIGEGFRSISELFTIMDYFIFYYTRKVPLRILVIQYDVERNCDFPIFVYTNDDEKYLQFKAKYDQNTLCKKL